MLFVNEVKDIEHGFEKWIKFVWGLLHAEKLPTTTRQRQDGATEHRTTKLCSQSRRWCKNGQGGGRVWTSCILGGSSSPFFLVDITLCETSNHGKDLTPVFDWCCLIFAFFNQWLMGWTLSCWHQQSNENWHQVVHHRPTYSPYRNPQMPGFAQVGDR